MNWDKAIKKKQNYQAKENSVKQTGLSPLLYLGYAISISPVSFNIYKTRWNFLSQQDLQIAA